MTLFARRALGLWAGFAFAAGLVAACSNSNFSGQEATRAAEKTATGTLSAQNPNADQTTPNPPASTRSDNTPGLGQFGTTATGTHTGTGTAVGTSGSSADAAGTLGTDGGNAAPCNTTADFVKLTFPADIQKCIDAGKIYDFDGKACFDDVTKATTYDCSKDGIAAAVTKLGMSPSLILANKTPNTKLIGCGERRGGQTVVLQWWVPPTTSGANLCTYSAGYVIGLECYGQFTTSVNVGLPGSAAGVDACVHAN